MFFFCQIKLLESESYQNAIESSIANEKVNAAYAVMINRDELVETFRHLEEPVIRRRINDMQEISNRLSRYWVVQPSVLTFGGRTCDPGCGGIVAD